MFENPDFWPQLLALLAAALNLAAAVLRLWRGGR